MEVLPFGSSAHHMSLRVGKNRHRFHLHRMRHCHFDSGRYTDANGDQNLNALPQTYTNSNPHALKLPHPHANPNSNLHALTDANANSKSHVLPHVLAQANLNSNLHANPHANPHANIDTDASVKASSDRNAHAHPHTQIHTYSHPDLERDPSAQAGRRRCRVCGEARHAVSRSPPAGRMVNVRRRSHLQER